MNKLIIQAVKKTNTFLCGLSFSAGILVYNCGQWFHHIRQCHHPNMPVSFPLREKVLVFPSYIQIIRINIKNYLTAMIQVLAKSGEHKVTTMLKPPSITREDRAVSGSKSGQMAGILPWLERCGTIFN
jgi:hypothetical protein